MKKELTCFHQVPIYWMRLEFCVTDDMVEAQENPRRIKVYGEAPIRNFLGLVWYRGDNLAIIIRKDSLTHDVIAHEILHATHRILSSSGLVFHEKSEEAYSYLCGYLTNYVYNQIKKWGLKVK